MSDLAKMRQKRKGVDGAKTTRHLAQYEFKRGEAPRRVQAHCYRCRGTHSWDDGCPLDEREV